MRVATDIAPCAQPPQVGQGSAGEQPRDAVQQPALGLALQRSWASRSAPTALRSSGLSSRSAASGAASRAATRSSVVAAERVRRARRRWPARWRRPRPLRRTGPVAQISRARATPTSDDERARAAQVGDEPERGLAHRELDVVGHHAQVGGEGELETRADRVALDRGHDHGRHLAPTRRSRAGRPRSSTAASSALSAAIAIMSVSPGTPPGASIARSSPAENDGPSPRQHDDPHVGVEAGGQLGEGQPQAGGLGVASLRVVEAHRQDGSVAGDGQVRVGLGRVGHAGRLSARSRTSWAAADVCARAPGIMDTPARPHSWAIRSRRIPSATMNDTATVRSTSSGRRRSTWSSVDPPSSAATPQGPHPSRGCSAMVWPTVATAALSLDPAAYRSTAVVGSGLMPSAASSSSTASSSSSWGPSGEASETAAPEAAAELVDRGGHVDLGVVGRRHQHGDDDHVVTEVGARLGRAGPVVVEVCRVDRAVGSQLAHVGGEDLHALGVPRVRRPVREQDDVGVGGHARDATPPTRSPSCSRSETTSPTTTTAGARTPAAAASAAAVARVVVVVRCSGVHPRSTSATGVSAGRPAAMSAAAVSASRVTPIRSTRVASGAASAAAARTCSAPSCAEATTKDAATPRWVRGMPAAAGTETADVTPGTTSTGTPWARQCRASSPPRPEDEGVAALEADDALAEPGVVDEELVDALLADRVVAGGLPDVDDLDVGAEGAQQPARAQPVGDDDVCRRQEGPPPHRDEVVGARDRLRRARPGRPRLTVRVTVGVGRSRGPHPADRQGAAVEGGEHGVPDGGGAAGVGTGADRDGEALARGAGCPTGDRGGPRGRGGGVVGPDAPDPRGVGLARDLRVDERVAGGRVHQPRGLRRSSRSPAT